jgi:hypothetical protein
MFRLQYDPLTGRGVAEAMAELGLRRKSNATIHSPRDMLTVETPVLKTATERNRCEESWGYWGKTRRSSIVAEQ